MGLLLWACESYLRRRQAKSPQPLAEFVGAAEERLAWSTKTLWTWRDRPSSALAATFVLIGVALYGIAGVLFADISSGKAGENSRIYVGFIVALLVGRVGGKLFVDAATEGTLRIQRIYRYNLAVRIAPLFLVFAAIPLKEAGAVGEYIRGGILGLLVLAAVEGFGSVACVATSVFDRCARHLRAKADARRRRTPTKPPI